MKIGVLLFSIIISLQAYSQDTLSTDLSANEEAMGTVTVYKDSRMDILAKKEAEFNDSKLLPNGTYAMKGFRLMLLSTSDRAMAMNIRAQLLQRYPDQKIYMSFQAPYLKLKFGNFVEKTDAEKFKNEIARTKLITTNIYVIPEMVEVKVDNQKDKEKEKENK
ncbi:hypothetical protein LK994_07430 [Ferruginibacter lapsinanis]|uniref:hypothetical protein n=1 Tax=Ferruginibacter lapsinanis TaxID=563172 RepID=UPI001E2DF688|nr:hypothetical protein [Ferruginibacter lapsinanis]UEG51300.1 hypothetical protein LK994_07430 [Ferruginibacter lapsinanis]